MKLIYYKDYIDESNYVMTNGKSYYIYDTFTTPILVLLNVKDDTGDMRWVRNDCFITLDKYREQQLEQLGI